MKHPEICAETILIYSIEVFQNKLQGVNQAPEKTHHMARKVTQRSGTHNLPVQGLKFELHHTRAPYSGSLSG